MNRQRRDRISPLSVTLLAEKDEFHRPRPEGVRSDPADLSTFLQMFTHLSRTPFVSEQNPVKDAKMKVAFEWRPFAAASVEGRMQRSPGNVCLTDRPRCDKFSSCR